MKIDILIPVASKTSYLKDALQSAYVQNVDKKIYLIENNISDVEFSVELKQLAVDFNAEYFYFEERLSIYENWQRCLTIGESEWVVFLHDDDIWNPNYLKESIKLIKENDIVFYEFRNFTGNCLQNTSKNINTCITPKSREELLVRSINMNVHMSSTMFKRSLNLKFKKEFKMLGDQYAFRSIISQFKNIKVSWIETENFNNIRQHPNQVTNSGVLIYVAKENALIYHDFFSEIQKERISLKRLGKNLAEYYDNKTLAKIFSSTFFHNNFFQQISLMFFILKEKNKIFLLPEFILRLFFQELVWNQRINRLHKL